MKLEKDPDLIPRAQPNDLKEIGQRLRPSRSTLRIISAMRNQRLAHADSNPDPSESLMSQRVDALVEDIKFAFNRLSTAHDGRVFDWDQTLKESSRHTNEILQALDSELIRRKQEFDEKLVGIVVEHMRNREAKTGRPMDSDEFDYEIESFRLDDDLEKRVRGVLRL